MESLQRLRHSIPGAVEHAGAISAVALLPRAADAVVDEFFSIGTHVSGGPGNVFPRSSLVQKSVSRQCGRTRFCLERLESSFPDVAEYFGGPRLDAVDYSFAGAGLE